jgi:hypothetical protein
VSTDVRTRRIAVVADSLLDELLETLGTGGWGVIQLPPAGLDAETTAEWIEQVAEHVSEFQRTGYEVVLADDGRSAPALTAALESLGTPPIAAYGG